MPAWHASLPQSPLFEGFNDEPVDPSVSTDMETGPPKRRRRFSVAYSRQTWRFILTGTQIGVLDSFYDSDLAGGSQPFTHTDPVTGSSASYLFRSKPTRAPLRPTASVSNRLWDVVCELEVVG